MSRVVPYIVMAVLSACLVYALYCLGEMNERIGHVEADLDAAKQSKVLSDQAADSAMRIREQIHETARQQLQQTEQALKNNGDWADQLVPDDVRRMLGKDPGTGDVPATGNPAR